MASLVDAWEPTQSAEEKKSEGVSTTAQQEQSPCTSPRWIMRELGSPLRAGGFNLLLLPFAGEDVVASLSLTVGLPLALVVPALASARLPFLSRPVCPVGRRVHLGGRLENSRQDESQSTYSKKTNEENKISVRSIKTYLVHLIRVVEWGYPPGSSGVVLVSCDARQPPLQHLISDLLRVDPSGVVETRVQPHWVVTSLERLDAPPEEDLHQVHTSHALVDKLNHSTGQHFDLGPFLRRHFRRSRFFSSVK